MENSRTTQTDFTRTIPHSQIENRHTQLLPRLRLSCTIHAHPQVMHLSLHPHFIDVWLTLANSGHSYFTQQRSFVNKYFHKWRTSPSTLTPLTLDLHMGTVATLTSLYNVHLFASVDVVPQMKTAGVVENSWHYIHSIGSNCFWNCLWLFYLVLYLLQSNTRYFVDHLERPTCHYIYIYIYIVVTTNEFCENKVLSIVNVELWQLKLHLLPPVVTLCLTYADDDDDEGYIYIYSSSH